MNERVSGMVAFTKLTKKTALLTAEAVSAKLSNPIAHTITFDNDTEFTLHGKITEALGIAVYFANPYSSWQREANRS